MKTMFKELHYAAAKFNFLREEVWNKIATLNPVELVTPINLIQEKKTWIENAKAGLFTNPHFVYDLDKCREIIKLEDDILGLRNRVYEDVPDEESEKFAWKLLIRSVNDALETVDMAKAMLERDDNELGRAVISKYGLPDANAVMRAEEKMKGIKERGTFGKPSSEISDAIDEDDRQFLLDSELTAEEIKYFFQWAMEEYLPGHAWPIKILKECSAIDVRDKSEFGHPIIAIPEDRRVNGLKLAELIGHEIECHWRNSINAKYIGALKCDSEVVYEGLAKLKDHSFNKKYLNEEVEPIPYYILSMEKALNGANFVDVAKYIFAMLPKKEKNLYAKTWNYTYRVFRGISNTGENLEAYAFTKDRAYFEGYLYAKSLRKHGMEEYLSFGTLNMASLQELKMATCLEDLEDNPSILKDMNLQEKAVEKILKYLKAADDGVEIPAEATDVEELPLPKESLKDLWAKANRLDPHDFGVNDR